MASPGHTEGDVVSAWSVAPMGHEAGEDFVGPREEDLQLELVFPSFSPPLRL